jgi:DNA-directed RNA polymerase specialized sigma24 family protein
MKNEFDLDVTFEEAAPAVSQLTEQQLAEAIAGLPVALQGVATGILVEGRNMSDVSQALGIRQAELVTRLHRAKIAIAAHFAN